MASGACDNLLMATYLSATCPVVVAPAMDEDMWIHPSTRQNLDKLRSWGQTIIPVEKGELASGLYGDGRMAEPETIIQFLDQHFFLKKDLTGKKVLVTAGPTYEPIDPVRFIGNNSTGKMGIALSRELAARGANVSLIIGPTALSPDGEGIQLIKVNTAEEMYQACITEFPKTDVAIMSAAVADYTPLNKSDKKIKKHHDDLNIELVKTKDILKNLGERKKNGQILVGFALETNNEKEYALNKLKNKNADLIVMNSLNDKGAGFGLDTNKVTIFDKNGDEIAYDMKPKQEVARDIVDRIVKMMHD
jgi:phosphopantothenoylcysteine decarboxylase/phosphopantothenate--cysteine ligase